MNFLSINLTDGYKLDHRSQYPEKTTLVYSNWTPRNSRNKDIEHVVVFGIQHLCQEYLIDHFNKNFFNLPKDLVLSKYQRRVNNYLGPNKISLDHIEKLHDLGYLPIVIKALPEGTLCPINIPHLVMYNTHADFAWLTNYLETLISCVLWKPMTSATIAYQYRKVFEKYADITGYDPEFIKFQGHDFSFRGMSGIEDSARSGAGHLLSFVGTDTLPAIDFLENYYFADTDKELVGCSVAATEHSVMCAGSKESEFETFKRLITEVYPTGIVSIVSDTWDLWKVLTDYLPRLKDEILAREGRVIIRPDSGDPVDIICGIKYTEITGKDDFYGYTGDIVKYDGEFYQAEVRDDDDVWFEPLKKQPTENEIIGAFKLLWNTFGGTINRKGYKELNPKIGLIYGDAITLDRQEEILKRLMNKEFSANNLVLGIGSYTYQYVTRDTFGFAMKSTYVEVDKEGIEIFKNPVTDSGVKKSAKGLIKVYEENGIIKMKDQCKVKDTFDSLLKTVFQDGELVKKISFTDIKKKLHG